MTPQERTLAHYQALALEAIFTRRDPGMMTDPVRASLRRAGLPIDAEGKAIVEKIDD